MKYKIIIVIILILSLVFLVGCQSSKGLNKEINQEIGKEMNNELTKEKTNQVESSINWKTQSSDGVVMVDLTPKKYVDKKLLFEIGISTHSVNNLDTYNLNEIVTLQANGKEYKPSSAPKLSGHHNFGELIFEVEEKPSKFIVLIDNLHDKETRKFQW